jgi:hypothetical protein
MYGLSGDDMFPETHFFELVKVCKKLDHFDRKSEHTKNTGLYLFCKCMVTSTVQQRQDMYLVLSCMFLILSLIPVSVFPWLVTKSTILDLDLQMEKKIVFVFVFFFFNTAEYLVYQSCFWWDQPSETIQNKCLTFQRQYVIIVSGN